MDDTRDDLAELRARLQKLEAQNHELRSEVASLKAADEPTSRRQLFKMAGAATAGVVGATLASALPAAADDGPAMTAGTPLSTAVVSRATYTGTAATSVAFLWESAAEASGSNAAPYPATVAALAYGTGAPANGFYGYSAKANGSGVVGHATHSTGGVGVTGRGNTSGVFGYSDSGIGVVAQGSRAAVQLVNLNTTPPLARVDGHSAGEIEMDAAGNLWVCVETGVPGRWRRVAGPSAAGSFHAVNPTRVFDSRLAAYGPSVGIFAPNTSREISVADGRDAQGGVATVGLVPPNSTAIAFNVTVTGTTNSNFLSVAAGTAAVPPSGSSINWTGANQSLANGLVTPISSTRTIKIFCGDQPGSTHVIIDVLGYYL